jgi:hypothetical protein
MSKMAQECDEITAPEHRADISWENTRFANLLELS